jgi:rRNA maturation RNase YbeY
MRISIVQRTKGKLPRLPFTRMKDKVLGAEYDLSLAFVGDAESRNINMKTRGKDYIPNVLSFELDDQVGEIFINPLEAERQAPSFGRTRSNFIAYLYIHALCHLKGMDHGSRMERTEAKFRKEFGI